MYWFQLSVIVLTVFSATIFASPINPCDEGVSIDLPDVDRRQPVYTFPRRDIDDTTLNHTAYYRARGGRKLWDNGASLTTNMCGTMCPMYLRGRHPITGHESHIVCVYEESNPCKYEIVIEMMACPDGDFRYKLPPTANHLRAYCFQ